MIIIACSHVLIGTFMIASSILPYKAVQYSEGYQYSLFIGSKIVDETDNWIEVSQGGKKLTIPLKCVEVKRSL